MNINNLGDLKKSINHVVIVSLTIFFILSLLTLKIIDNRAQSISEIERIKAASDSLIINLNKQIYLIAVSAFFSDYLHSGPLSRSRNEAYFLQRIALVEPDLIIGNTFTENSHPILTSGETSPYFITYKLCYFDEKLDETYGRCHHQWTVYLSKQGLIKALTTINPAITACQNCPLQSIFDKPNHFQDLPIVSMSQMALPIELCEGNTIFSYLFVGVFLSCLIGFAYWSSYRIKYHFNKTLIRPIENITKNLQANEYLDENDTHIVELQYLSKQVNDWQKRISDLQGKEQEILFGKFAAEVAHDIRSPIATLRIMLNQVISLPEHHKIILKKAIDSISAIASYLLTKYKKEEESSMQSVYLMLENILYEKKIQYPHIQFKFLALGDEAHYSVYLQYHIFIRILSNILDNAIEALTVDGKIEVNLTYTESDIKIRITDNGCGIPPHILSRLLIEPISYGKKHGHGLGLSYTQKYIHEWGGKITIDSVLNKFTTVEIVLPKTISH